MKLNQADYHTQKNNAHRPLYECGNTSLANLLCCDGYPGDWCHYDFPVDDYIYEWLRGPKAQDHAKTIGKWAERTPEQVPEMLRFCAEELSGIPHKLTYQGNLDEILPAVIATDFYKGHKNGHYILVHDFYPGGFIVSDPFGNPLNQYTGGSGYAVKIPVKTMLNNYHGIAVYGIIDRG